MIIIGVVFITAIMVVIFVFPPKTQEERLNEIYKLLPKAYDAGNFSMLHSLEFEAGYLIENHQLEKSKVASSICFELGRRFMHTNYSKALIWLEKAIKLTPEEKKTHMIYPPDVIEP